MIQFFSPQIFMKFTTVTKLHFWSRVENLDYHNPWEWKKWCCSFTFKHAAVVRGFWLKLVCLWPRKYRDYWSSTVIQIILYQVYQWCILVCYYPCMQERLWLSQYRCTVIGWHMPQKWMFWSITLNCSIMLHCVYLILRSAFVAIHVQHQLIFSRFLFIVTMFRPHWQSSVRLKHVVKIKGNWWELQVSIGWQQRGMCSQFWSMFASWDLGYYCSKYKYQDLLHVVLCIWQTPTFWNNLLPPSSGTQ